MDDYSFFDDCKPSDTVNPADLHKDDLFTYSALDAYGTPAENLNLRDLTSVDSAVDLTMQWNLPGVKQEPLDQFDQLLDLLDGSQASTNTPSPGADMTFSNANSPGDFLRDHSQAGSPETTNDILSQDGPAPQNDDAWIMIPQPREIPRVHLVQDKTKTRAETQIKMQLTLDPVGLGVEFIHFPRKTLAKPKHFATAEEKKEIESKGEVIYMDVLLVCATAVEKHGDLEKALRRAAGKEPVPRRPAEIAISELDKDDPAHPQNGGEVLICEGCKERERKRYDRKKKRADDEKEWMDYESDRVVMINEKEYKKWKEVEPGDLQLSSRAKQVEFAMRIACYCRHQEEKSPVGYRVIFTFKDSRGNVLNQHSSDIFQITDDHKNKDVAPEALPRPLTIPQAYMVPQYNHTNNIIPYQYPVENQYPTTLGPYSQPPTPVRSSFQPSMSPMDTTFPQTTTAASAPQPPRQTAPTFCAASSSMATSQYPRHQHRQSAFDVPMLSPTNGISPESQYLPRPQSMDNFNFNSEYQVSQHQGFASAPHSAVTTPINLSRPASPTWEQGRPAKKKTLRCVYFYVDE